MQWTYRIAEHELILGGARLLTCTFGVYLHEGV